VADTYVDSKFPSKSFGSATVLRVALPPVQQTFLRFTVSGIGPAGVAQARLRLTVKPGGGGASNSGGTVHRISSNTWSESTTYNTRPTIDGAGLGTQGAVTPNQVVVFDVTSAVTTDGTYDFALETPAGNGVQYQSREASIGKPQLQITPR
jgi:hypothetical protein